MFFKHIYDKTLAQGSYLIGCQAKKEAIVIDPRRDIDVYLQVAKENGLKITHITETHIHADFLSGARELAAVTGATLYLSDEGGEGWQYEFPHHGVKDGDVIKVGNLSLEVMHTPGHTPESISFILTDHPATDEPTMAFTGDFLFVGDIGRPDLLEEAAGQIGTKRIGAEQMYDSIQRFAQLPDHIQVWPAHGAGSACGKSLGAVPSSTIGYEKFSNWAFRYADDKEGFIDFLLSDQPEPPKYFAMMKHLNKVNRPLLVETPKHPQLTDEELERALNRNIKTIDTRGKDDFYNVHVPGTISITGNNSFANWAGWFLNYQEQIILVCEPEEMEDLTIKLMRIGLDNIYGFVTPEQLMRKATEQTDLLDIESFQAKLEDSNVQVVDVRNKTEFKQGHIKGANHVFLGTIIENTDKISKDKEVIIHCQSGARAAIAYSLLRKEGFTNLSVYPGGMAEWKAKGNAVEQGVAVDSVV